jgi:peptidoglycan/LPS O-acetylase OafA/YrhL
VKHRLVHLDFLNGIAAILVCISHLSAFLFVPFKQAQSSGLLIKAFYFLSTLGHQAVLLFFVLSGYLVGGSVIMERLSLETHEATLGGVDPGPSPYPVLGFNGELS